MKIWGYTLHPSGLRPGVIVSSSYKKFPALRNTMREIIFSKLQTNYLRFFLANTSLAAAWAAAKRAIGTRKAEQET